MAVRTGLWWCIRFLWWMAKVVASRGLSPPVYDEAKGCKGYEGYEGYEVFELGLGVLELGLKLGLG